MPHPPPVKGIQKAVILVCFWTSSHSLDRWHYFQNIVQGVGSRPKDFSGIAKTNTVEVRGQVKGILTKVDLFRFGSMVDRCKLRRYIGFMVRYQVDKTFRGYSIAFTGANFLHENRSHILKQTPRRIWPWGANSQHFADCALINICTFHFSASLGFHELVTAWI
jgi:hypothetical protein